MKKILLSLSLVSIILFIAGCNCNESPEPVDEVHDTTQNQSIYVLSGDKHFLKEYEPLCENGDINVVVEIPAGTLEKWEVDKKEGNMKLEFVDEKPRIVQYLAYPGNYGMIPQTLLPKELGGDGDPLDVIVLGDASPLGSVIQCKVIGVLVMFDRGEQDDKLIAVKKDSPFYNLNSIEELDKKFIGVSDIISIWFANYKGPGKIEVVGFEEKQIADEILQTSIDEFQKAN